MRTCCLLLLTAAAATRTGDDLHSTRASVVLSPQNSCLIRTDRQTDRQTENVPSENQSINQSISKPVEQNPSLPSSPPRRPSFIRPVNSWLSLQWRICQGSARALFSLPCPLPAVVVVQRDSFTDTEELLCTTYNNTKPQQPPPSLSLSFRCFLTCSEFSEARRND